MALAASHSPYIVHGAWCLLLHSQGSQATRDIHHKDRDSRPHVAYSTKTGTGRGVCRQELRTDAAYELSPRVEKRTRNMPGLPACKIASAAGRLMGPWYLGNQRERRNVSGHERSPITCFTVCTPPKAGTPGHKGIAADSRGAN